MRELLSFILIFTTVLSYSQRIKTETNVLPIGKNYITSSEILGTKHTFRHHIYKYHIDTTFGHLTFQFKKTSKAGSKYKNRGYIVQYDLQTEELLWKDEVFFNSKDIFQYEDFIIYSTGIATAYCVDAHKGNTLWMINKRLYFADLIYKIGLGYDKDQFSTKLKGIDLVTGKKIWKRRIDPRYRWEDVFYINDSTILIVAAGLHSLNLKNGEGWDYPYVIDIVSNILLEDEGLFFASRNDFFRLDQYTGERIWGTHLPDDLVSRSSIFSDDSLIYMVDYGYPDETCKTMTYKKPFIAAFYKETGEKKYLTEIIAFKESLLDYLVLNNELILVFEKRVLRYSITNGELVSEKTFYENEKSFVQFLGSNIYTQNSENSFSSLQEKDSTVGYLYNANRKTFVIDQELNHKESIEYDSLYVFYLETGNYKFIIKDNKTKVINNKGKIVAELNVSREATLIGNTLYDKDGESFFEVDLTEIIENNK